MQCEDVLIKMLRMKPEKARQTLIVSKIMPLLRFESQGNSWLTGKVSKSLVFKNRPKNKYAIMLERPKREI